MIIFEGPDGSGKSYLVQYLLEKAPDSFSLFPTQGPPKSRADLLCRMDSVLDLQQPGKETLVDRFALFSEQVYGPIVRDGCLLSDEDIQSFTGRLLKEDPLIVFCRPSIKTITGHLITAKAHKLPDHVEKVQAQRLRLIYQYDRVMMRMVRSGLNILWFNRDTMPTEELHDVWISPMYRKKP